MTLLADMKWTCTCGHENTTQLYTNDEEHCGETFENGSVPDGCDINFDYHCHGCKEKGLPDDPVKQKNGMLRWEIKDLAPDETEYHKLQR